MIWESRDGAIPKDVPDCGFYNEHCRVVTQNCKLVGGVYCNFISLNVLFTLVTHWIIIGAICSLVLLCFIVTAVIYYIR